MRDPEFLNHQRSTLYAPHIAPVNALVDALSYEGRGWVPHVAPIHAGVDARLLWILRDPGPMTIDPEQGTRGFLSVENDDPTAERLCTLLTTAGIRPEVTLPWNAYPWYINRAPTVAELRVGVDSLRRLLKLLPRLDVVLLLGRHAQRSADLLAVEDPVQGGRAMVFCSRHPGRQAFVGPPDQHSRWQAEQQGVFNQAALALRHGD